MSDFALGLLIAVLFIACAAGMWIFTNWVWNDCRGGANTRVGVIFMACAVCLALAIAWAWRRG